MNKALRFLLILAISAVMLRAPAFHAAAQGECDPAVDYVTVGFDALYSSENYEEAIAAFDCAQELTSDPAELAWIYIGRGDAYWYMDENDEAFENYSAALELDPSNPEAWLSRGIYYYIAFDTPEMYAQAIADFDQAIQLDPEYAEAYRWRGEVYQYIVEDERAIEDFNQALALDPSDQYTYYYRGISLQYLDRDEEAIEDFNQALALDENFGDVYAYRGVSLQYLDRDEEAIEDFNRALEYDPEDVYAYQHRGISLAYLDRDEEAINDYTEALARAPEDPFTLMMRALSYIWLDNTDAAWQDLEQADALDVDEAYPDIDLYRGVLYQAAGDDENALVAFETYLSSYPDDAFAWRLLGESLFYLERDEEAVEALSQAIALSDPEYDQDVIADAQFYRGVTYYYAGDYEAALEDLNGTAEYFEDDAWTYAYRSEVYYELGDEEAALADIQYAVELEPEEASFLDMAEENGFDPSEFELEPDQSADDSEASAGEDDLQGDESGSEAGYEDDGFSSEDEYQDDTSAEDEYQDDVPAEGDYQEDSQPADDGASMEESGGEEETGYIVPDGKTLRLRSTLRRDDPRDTLRSRTDNSVRSRSRGQDRGSTRGSTRVS